VDLIRPNASFIPQNIGRATMTGGSVELAWPSAASLGGALNVTVTRAVDDSTGTQLLRVPWVTSGASLYLPVSGGTLSVLATYVGSRLDVDPAAFTTILMPGYVVIGLRFARGTQDTGQWQLGVDNLGGLQYEPIAGFPAPGRTAFVSFVRSF
jgi:outer membrane cobalamin receptor